MRQAIVTAVSLIAAFLLQTAILPMFGVTAISPDLIFAVLIPAAMLWNPIPVAFMGAAAGLMVDILFGQGIGAYAIPYLLAPWLAGVYGKQFFRENAFLPAGIAAGAFVARELLLALFIYLGRMPITITWGIALRTLGSAAITMGVSIPFHLLLYGSMLKHERRRPGLIYFGR